MKINNEKQKRALYSAAALVLCIAALGSFWLTKKDSTKPQTENTTESTTEITENQTQVNSPVTNIPDERVTVTTAPESCYFALPSENNITKHFSGSEMVKNTTTDDWRAHTGIDIAGGVGDPVKCICDGTVSGVRDDALWGTVVTVDHGNGIVSEYRGLGRGSTPEVGEKIKINEKVGNLGEIPIEKADGVHLHLEIRENGTLMDPEKVIGQTYEFKS